MAKAITYRDSGVDIDAGDAFVDVIKTVNPTIGGFGGFVSIPKGMKNPKIVISTDGVGTKLLVARELNNLSTIGIDLVAMVVNDIITTGARPTSFLDYYAMDKLDTGESADVLKGIVDGCNQAGCKLVGGETAELPGVYPKGGFDLAGFGLGFVDKSEAIDGTKTKAGDVIIGLPSSGIHSNGYSLARRALLEGKKAPRGEKRKEILEAMLTPTSIYVAPVLKLIKKVKVKGIAHITGGGLTGNLVRVLPEGLQAVINPQSWDRPSIFQLIQSNGPVDEAEMFRVFNMGIGLCIVVSPKDLKESIKILRRAMVHPIVIGEVVKGETKVSLTGVAGLE